MRDDHINLLFLKIFSLIIVGVGLYYQAGSNGVAIACFTILMMQVLGIKYD